jgi:hypothetical protein
MAVHWDRVVEELVRSIEPNSTDLEVSKEISQNIRYLCEDDKRNEASLFRDYYRKLNRFLEMNCTDEETRNDDQLPDKIGRWQHGLKALTKYGLNLISSPNHKVYHRIKLTSPYFVYNVKKKCTGGEDFLVAMGYERQPNSNEFHYKGKSARELGKVVVEIVAIAEVLDMLLEESQRLKEWGKTYSLSSAFYTAFKTAMLIVGGGSFGQERATHGDSSGTAPLHSGRSPFAQ